MISLSRFLPREDKFYLLMARLADEAEASASHLKTFIESADPVLRQQAGSAITESKARAKELVATVTKELCFTFVTPFDREDIQDFAADLYKITKTIEKVRERIALHGLLSNKGDFSRQIDLIVREAAAMHSMVQALIHSRNNKEIVARAQELQNLEQQGDEVLGDLLVSLFREHQDARDLILRKDIYDMLEKVIDRYRDAAGVALQIVLKHS